MVPWRNLTCFYKDFKPLDCLAASINGVLSSSSSWPHSVCIICFCILYIPSKTIRTLGYIVVGVGIFGSPKKFTGTGTEPIVIFSVRFCLVFSLEPNKNRTGFLRFGSVRFFSNSCKL